MALKPKRVRQFYIWHKWTGLITGLFIFVICLSGAVLVFKEEIDRAITPAKVVRPSGEKVPLDQAMANARRGFPKTRIVGITLPERADAAYELTAIENRQRTEIFVNPYTGAVTGSRSGETLANFLRQLHLRFYLFGFWGRVVVGVFGATLVFSTVSGLVIYFRFMRGIFSRGLHFWSIRSGWQLSTSDWHKLIGVAALAFNLLISVTGAVLGLENLTRFTPGLSSALQHRPASLERASGPIAAVPPADAGPRGPRISMDEALRISRASMPGFVPQNISLPGGPLRGFNGFMVAGTMGGRLDQNGASYVLVDAGGSVVEKFSQHDGTATNTFNYLMMPLHFGAFGGLGLKIVYLLFGLTASFLSVTGFMLWWMKWRKLQPATERKASARGVLAAEEG